MHGLKPVFAKAGTTVAWLKEIGTAGLVAFPPKLRMDGARGAS
jgi:hypothetical protein